MNCADAAERITALVDGELSPGERTALESHLGTCAACRDLRAAEEAVAARLRSARRPSVPPGFAASVMARVATAPAPESARPAGRLLPLWPFILAGAATAAAVLAMVLVGPGETGHFVADRPAPAALDGGGGGPAPVAIPSAAPESTLREGDRPAVGGDAARGKDAPATDSRAPGYEGGEVPPPAAEPVTAVEAESGKDDRAGGPGGAESAPLGGGGGSGAEARQADRADEDGEAESSPAGPPPRSEPAKKAEEKARNGRRGEKESWDKKPAPAPADAALPRRSVFFRVGSLSAGQKAVEGTLFALRDFSYVREPWKEASEVDSAWGRLRKGLEEREKRKEDRGASVTGGLAGAFGESARREVPLLPGEKVLEIRMKAKDFERLRSALIGEPGLKEARAQTLVATGEELPPEYLDRLRATLEEEDRRETELKDEARKEKEAGLVNAEEAEAAGPAKPGEPAPPPSPTPDQLKNLAKAPRAERPAASRTAGGSEEVVVEIHLFENLLEMGPPRAPTPAGAPEGGGK